MSSSRVGRPRIPDSDLTPEQKANRERNQKYAKSRAEREKLGDVISLHSKKVDSLTNEVSNMKSILDTKEKTIFDLEQQNQELSKCSEILKTEVENLKSSVSKKTETIQSLKKENSFLEESTNHIQDEIKKIKVGYSDSIENLKGINSFQSKEISSLKNELDNLKLSLNDIMELRNKEKNKYHHLFFAKNLANIIPNFTRVWLKSFLAILENPRIIFYAFTVSIISVIMFFLQYEFYVTYEPSNQESLKAVNQLLGLSSLNIDTIAAIKAFTVEFVALILGFFLSSSRWARGLWVGFLIYIGFSLGYTTIDNAFNQIDEKITNQHESSIDKQVFDLTAAALKDAIDKGESGNITRRTKSLHETAENIKTGPTDFSGTPGETQKPFELMILMLGGAFVFLRLILLGANAFIAHTLARSWKEATN